MNTLTLAERFKVGQELTGHELAEAFKRIYGKPLPRGRKSSDLARALAAHEPVRFEFEVNRLRGFAWDHGCPPVGPD